ncbi:MAG: hypothetical protein K2W82_02110 [Candidatus Obscuribacterales bacterium]|nr:hypothetical protein [Candidatus Obscuribacterales bacterium]
MSAKTLMILFVAITFCPATYAQSKGKEAVMPPIMQNQAKPIEVTGEVVDAWCWSSGVMGPGQGAKHKSCALACIAGGVTAGIVDDKGNLYIAAKSKAYNGCRDQLLPFVAKRVKVKGYIASRGGCRVLKISEVKEVK